MTSAGCVGKNGKTVWHITSECEKLAQGEYKRRHDNDAGIIHWELCEKYGIDRTKNWYEQRPIGVMENDKAKIPWDFMIQCDKMIEHRKPDIVLVDKVQQKCLTIDVTCPGDNRVAEKEEEKLQRYDLLKREIKKLWRMKNIDIIPIIVGALTRHLQLSVHRAFFYVFVSCMKLTVYWLKLSCCYGRNQCY